MLITEFFSRNENYKAVISKEASNFLIQFYRWNETSSLAKEAPIWEQIETPIVAENQEIAESLAQKNLAIYAGESPDQCVSCDVIETVRSVLGHDNFVFLETKNFSTSFLENETDENFKPLESQKILAIDEFYFVENFEKTWYAGFLYQIAEIRCWRKFESLEAAIIEIIKK